MRIRMAVRRKKAATETAAKSKRTVKRIIRMAGGRKNLSMSQRKAVMRARRRAMRARTVSRTVRMRIQRRARRVNRRRGRRR